jgi:8-hydroxy-5-deazaflavin:NADPH oxidoreductase
MKIGVLGTGMVGSTLATKLAELGHEVKMGSRQPGNEKAVAPTRQARTPARGPSPTPQLSARSS